MGGCWRRGKEREMKFDGNEYCDEFVHGRRSTCGRLARFRALSHGKYLWLCRMHYGFAQRRGDTEAYSA